MLAISEIASTESQFPVESLILRGNRGYKAQLIRLLKTYQLGFTYNLGRNPQSGLIRVRESPWSTACKLQGDSQTCTQSSPLCPCDQLWSQGHSYMCPRCHRTPWTHITDCSHDLAWLGFHVTLAMQELAHMAITIPWMACGRAFSCSGRLPMTTQRHASVAAWSRATWGAATSGGPPTCTDDGGCIMVGRLGVIIRLPHLF